MRIVIISGTAPPEPLTASRINWDVANQLATEGNEVWLISPKPSRPLGAIYPKINGIHINKITDNFHQVYVNSFTCPKYNILGRSYESLDFGIKSIGYVNRKIKDCDLIYASTWPFLCQLMIVLLRRDKKIPLIMNIQDLYPESFFIKIKSKAICFLFKPLYAIDKLIVHKSTHLTVISESLKQVYLNKRKIPESKISVIKNWQDAAKFINASVSKQDVIKKYDLDSIAGRFIFMYLGNLGPVAGVENIMYSFSEFDDNKSFLIIAGSGSAKEKCKSLARLLNITNLVFLEISPDLQSVVELQSISDVLLLPINPEAANSSIPSKLIAYMFSGKPVITSAARSSETAKAINDSGCGWITASHHSSEWKAIMQLACRTNETTLRRMGKSGFDYAVRNYSKEEGLRRICQLIYSFTMN